MCALRYRISLPFSRVFYYREPSRGNSVFNGCLLYWEWLSSYFCPFSLWHARPATCHWSAVTVLLGWSWVLSCYLILLYYLKGSITSPLLSWELAFLPSTSNTHGKAHLLETLYSSDTACGGEGSSRGLGTLSPSFEFQVYQVSILGVTHLALLVHEIALEGTLAVIIEHDSA